MSLLAPLYFLGALAISLPILFHLIRRQPKGQVEFSSLMFLQPTPPRLTRRSRLDNWPLLLLRALALGLLAAAFARPFLRSVSLSDQELPGRKLVLLVDTSASMQRAGLWQQALDKAADVLSDLQPADHLAIVTFDSRPSTLLGFDQASGLTPAQLKSTVNRLLRQQSPTWRHTAIGKAIAFAGDLAASFEPEGTELGVADFDSSDPAKPRGSSAGPVHVVLISDLQAGSHLESLQVYAWPKQLRLDVRPVATRAKTNASAQILAKNPEAAGDGDSVRVRVTNSPDATESRFRIRWANAAGGAEPESSALTQLPVQVPPGQSRVVRMPPPAPGISSLVLQGDEHTFDNTRYLVSPQPQSKTLLHLGTAASDPRDSLLYYLQRVPLSNPYRDVSVDSLGPDQLAEVPDPETTPLAVLETAVPDGAVASLRDYVSAGGRLLVVMTDASQSTPLAKSVNAIADSALTVSEASVDDYAMFSQIDFRHPIFAAMADPKFNDFTKIRFWAHRRLAGLDQSWRVVASFDDGDPALIECSIDAGSLLVLAAGWQPGASQLALSTKFIPFVYSLFEAGRGSIDAADRYTVGDAIAIAPSQTATIMTPAGTAIAYRSSDDLEGIDQPGIYVFRDGQDERSFAVNLAASESQTEAISDDELERRGAILGKTVSAQQARESQRQLRDRELEREQKLWQWLLVAALVVLGLETLLGMWWSRTNVGALPPTDQSSAMADLGRAPAQADA